MRQPVLRTRDGVDVYAHVNDGGGWEQYGIRRTAPARFEFVPIASIDPFDTLPTLHNDEPVLTFPARLQPRYLTAEEIDNDEIIVAEDDREEDRL